MERIRNISNSKNFIFYVMILSFSCFLLNFIFNVFVNAAFPYIVCIISSIYSLIAAFLFIINKNTKPALMMVFFFPFIHGNFITVDFNTLFAFIPAIFMVIAVVLHHILYKTKLKMQKLFLGLIIYMVGVAIGGIGSKSVGEFYANFKWYFIFYILIVCAIIIYVMLVISSDIEMNLHDYAILITYTGLFVCAEVIAYWAIMPFVLDIPENAFFAPVQLGWGNKNNVATQLLMFLPGPMYLHAKDEDKKIYYASIGYLFVFFIVLVFSRGACGVLAFVLPFVLAYSIIVSKKKKQTIIIHASFLGAILIAFSLLLLINQTLFHKIWDILLDLRFNSFNGRSNIYESLFEIWGENKAFGVGLIGSFNWFVDCKNYQFAHNSFLQMLLVSGIVGTVLFSIYILDKYFHLLKNPTKEKLMVLSTFLFPGLYGLMDVTYLNPVFMVTMLASYCMINDIFKDEDPRFYIYG